MLATAEAPILEAPTSVASSSAPPLAPKPIAPSTPAPAAETRIILEKVSWGLYEHLLAEHPNRPSPRFAYSDGFLEIMTTGVAHESPNRKLALLVELVAAVWRLDCEPAGSITCKREDLEKGFEPDSCFYFGPNAPLVRDKEEFVFPEDPPPDLTIEIDITNSSLPRQPIFAALGIAEVWRFDGRRVRILRLEAGSYVEVAVSVLLAPLNAETINRFLEEGRTLAGHDRISRVNEWAQAQIASGARHLPASS